MAPFRRPLGDLILKTPVRIAATLTSTALAVLLVQPLVASPANAGAMCDSSVPVGDCTPPETTITSAPTVDDEGRTEATDADFTFEATDESDTDTATFECRLDQGETVTQDWSDCTDSAQTKAGHSTGSESFTGLGPGSYTFSVRATDTPDGPFDPANTETTPATFDWTVFEPEESRDPDTVITAGARRWHPYSFLGITYRADEETSAFECTLNGRERSCDDDQVTLLGMRAGDYVFTVAAVDTDGNVDLTPAKERWSVPLNNTALAEHSWEWRKRTGSGYFQDSYSVTDRRGAFIEQGRRGFRSLVLVATRCPGCGRVAVLLRDKRVATVSLSAPRTRKRQIIAIDSWRRKQTGRVRIEVLTQGKDVLIEGIGFSGRR